MKKKAFIISMFILVFALALGGLWLCQQKKTDSLEVKPVVLNEEAPNDDMHTYLASDIKISCDYDDEIFCAIEKTVKCTLAPDMDGCDETSVPKFVIGKTEDNVRPTIISFKLTKIKPNSENGTIAVYTQSDCNASWFGLCKGTVIYALEHSDTKWAVKNIYALEQ